jgi:hypothetical protein
MNTTLNIKFFVSKLRKILLAMTVLVILLTAIPVSEVQAWYYAGMEGSVTNAAPSGEMSNLWDFFQAAASNKLCVIHDDGLVSTVQSVYCEYPEANVVYHWFRDKYAQDEMHHKWLELSGPNSIEQDRWYAATSSEKGQYMLSLTNGKAYLAWRVFGSQLSGFAYRNDTNKDALAKWWESTGNSHPGSPTSQLGATARNRGNSDVPVNPDSPEGELRAYFAGIGISEDACLKIDDGIVGTLVTIRCKYIFPDSGMDVIVDYSKWSSNMGVSSAFDQALKIGSGCKVQEWYLIQSNGLKKRQGTLYLCVTPDDKNAYVYWNVDGRYYTALAIAQNTNDVTLLYNAWKDWLAKLK